MAHRANVILPDSTWRVLKTIPRGERSTVINTALVEWFKMCRRIQAARRMDALRAEMPPVPVKKIVGWIREQRAGR